MERTTESGWRVSPADVAYNARLTVSTEEFDHTVGLYRRTSDQAITRLEDQGFAAHRDLVFDPASGEKLDVLGVQKNDDGALRPAFIAIHGGYWRALSRLDTAFMAEAFAAEGIATIPLDYTLAPAVTLEEITRQVRAAVAWVYHHGAEYGVDPERIFVLGSSAGGHLAAMTMVGGWQAEFGVPGNVIKGGVLISGLFEISPLIGTEMNMWLHLDQDRARALSPLLAPATSIPAVVALGEHEATGFFHQSEQFHHKWSQTAGSTFKVIENKHHFDVFLDLADPDSWLCRQAVGMVTG